jgi:uncharacterized protein (DUF302 family)
VLTGVLHGAIPAARSESAVRTRTELEGVAMTSTGTSRPDVVELPCGSGFAAVLDRLDAEIAARGLTVFARVDHAANARAVGLEMPPTTVLLVGNARGGTPLMLRAPALALDLPLRLLVRETPEGTVVSYHDPAATLAAFGLPASAAHPLLGLADIAVDVAGGGPAPP